MVIGEWPGIGDGGGELNDNRRRVIELAVGLEGLNAGSDPGGYIDLVGPNETPQMQHDMLSMSGCALARVGIERRAGIAHPLYDGPYRLKSAVTRIEAVARSRGAWREAGISLRMGLALLPGDAVIVDRGGPHEHVITVLGLARLPDAAMIKFCSLDGGQKGRSNRPGDVAEYQMIKRFNRTWALTFGGVQASTVVSGAFDAVVQVPGDVQHPVRRVSAWIDLDALFAGQ